MGRQRTVEMGSAVPVDAVSLKGIELKNLDGALELSQPGKSLLNEVGLPARLKNKQSWHGRRQTGWFRS